jgi:flagellar assembly protein FliH
MSGFIPKEKLTAYQRWELAAFDEEEREAALPDPPQPLNPPPAEAPPEIAPTAEPKETPPPVNLPTVEDVERMYAEAHESGHASGYEEGSAQARAEAAQIHTLLGNVDRSLQDIDQLLANQLLALALEIAGQVLRQSLRVKPELLLPVVREAVSALAAHHGHPILFVSPDDAALVRTHLGEQLANNNWRILEDATVTLGGCRVELAASEVDATLETRWRRVIEALGVNREWLAEATPSGSRANA